jgi:hypothetical protein
VITLEQLRVGLAAAVDGAKADQQQRYMNLAMPG